MADDKSKDEKEETGRIKKNLSDEFDEAAGKKKGKNDQDDGGKNS